ncbi:hypothetical protein GJAV_G00133630 [Gymnothorax javanicus]|nr:hypothetical protein GJAV_G00133630 [Gymnothorax javanicus]
MAKRRRPRSGRRNKPHLYIMRGLPGSGKSKLARKILNEKYGGRGEIFSTDDYFKDASGVMVNFDESELDKAHGINIKNAKHAMRNRINPVIIDNTNIFCCEMKPYVRLGLRYGYHVRFRYLSDSWKVSVETLHRRTNGKVPLEKMKKMKENYEFIDNIYDVLWSPSWRRM